ncbi:MAG: regulatory protein RecX [Dehalococcoidia bacterium]
MRSRRRDGPPAEPMLLSEIETATGAQPDAAIDADPQSLQFRVSAIERQERRNRYNVFVNGEFAVALEPDVLVASGLRVDAVVTAERLRELSVEDLRKRALNAALHLLASRPRSEAEMRTRLLRRELPHDIVTDTLARLREYGYVNDAEFARFWVESRSGANPRGRYVVQRELRSKGVAQETADAAMEELTEEASAERAARKKLRSLRGFEYPAFRNRLTGYLVRRGFGYEVVRRIVSDLWKETNGAPPDDDQWPDA